MSATSAHDLSQVLESVKEKVESYNAERKKLSSDLRGVIDQAQQLLSTLGEGDAPARGRSRGSVRGRIGRPRNPGRPRGSKMSAEARARIAAAQKARWAKVRAEKKK